MPEEQAVARHYSHGALIEAIEQGLAALGKSRGSATLDDLAPIDEFHIGGREASEAFFGQLPLAPGIEALDIGCGLGGGARFAASAFGCRVTGIDLTPDYVETGAALCRWVGLDDRVSLQCASALSMPFADARFDVAYMMHVGMNIADKAALAAEAARVLTPGGVFAIYDVMRVGPGALAFPVPWAETAATSALDPAEAYRAALDEAGLEITVERDRAAFALDFFERMRARAAAGGLPPLGIHVLMGENRAEKIANMRENIAAGRIAPVELIARKPG